VYLDNSWRVTTAVLTMAAMPLFTSIVAVNPLDPASVAIKEMHANFIKIHERLGTPTRRVKTVLRWPLWEQSR
jgi:hypothetical protein